MCTKEEPIYIVEELMDQNLNSYLQDQNTKDKTSLKDLVHMSAQVCTCGHVCVVNMLYEGANTEASPRITWLPFRHVAFYLEPVGCPNYRRSHFPLWLTSLARSFCCVRCFLGLGCNNNDALIYQFYVLIIWNILCYTSHKNNCQKI